MDNPIGFSSYHHHPEEDSPTRRDFLKNLAAYQYWQGKLPNWKAQQILNKLRAYNVQTSKNDVLQSGEICYSAYQLFKYWLENFGTKPKFLENFGFIWAAAERLWDEFIPNIFCVEQFLKAHLTIKTNDATIPCHVLLPRYLENWAVFVHEFVPPFQSIEELEPLYPRTSWVATVINEIAQTCKLACIEKNKLLLEVVNFIYLVEEKFPDAPASAAGFLELQIWFAIINDKTEEVDRLLDLYGYNLSIDSPIYMMITELYTNPLPFAFNTRAADKGMNFYHKLIQRFQQQNQQL
jgi:hypothetical protein